AGSRSRGPSVSSAMSTGYQHGEFTPTLAPRNIHDDGLLSRPSAGMRPSSYAAGTQQQQQQQQQNLRSARPRAGTGASIGSALAAGTVSFDQHGERGLGDDGDGAAASDGIADDPLALFQQEESQLWGGGTRSTLPRLGAGRSRSRSRGRAQLGPNVGDRRSSVASNDADSVRGIRSHSPANMARSEYIGHVGNPSGGGIGSRHHNQLLNQHQQQQGGMAASTPALRENSALLAANDYDGQRGHDASAESGAGSVSEQYKGYSAGSGTASSSSTASFGVRLLRSPKALGDGIMSRLTYALNGMMDVDPEQLRRNQIGRASDKISMLEDQLEMLSNDLVLINTSTQDNLDRFQKQKVRELKGVLIAMAKMHLEWAEKNLEIWRETKEIIDEA
ncbi:Sorting nexin, cytoplasm-to-vacuole targeting pathway/endosomal sorting, partial [Coemansia sp. RSA 2598]